MKLFFLNCNKQLFTSVYAQENLNVFNIPKSSGAKNTGLEIRLQTALKSVKQAKVVLTISVNEVGISVHLHEAFNSASDRLVHFLR